MRASFHGGGDDASVSHTKQLVVSPIMTVYCVYQNSVDPRHAAPPHQFAKKRMSSSFCFMVVGWVSNTLDQQS